MQSTVKSKINFTYLIQESILFLVFSYFIVVGLKGLLVFSIQRLNIILLCGAGVIWLAWRIIRRRPFPHTPIDIPLCVWLVSQGIATAFSSNPRQSLETFNLYLLYSVFYYVVVDLTRAGWPAELWEKIVLLAGAFGLGLGIIQFMGWYQNWFAIGGWDHLIPPATTRISSTLIHPNMYAAFLNLLFPLALTRLFSTRAWVAKFFLGIWALVGLVSIYFTSSRGGWLGTAAMFAVLALLLVMDHWKTFLRGLTWLKQHRLVIAGLVVGAALGVVLGGLLLLRQVNHPSHPQGGDARGYIWIVGWDMLKQSPFVGKGPGTFGFNFARRYSIPPDKLLVHAHNAYLNTLAETGLLGFAALAFLLISFGVFMLRFWRQQPAGQHFFQIGILAGLAGLAVHSFFDTPQSTIFINLIIAILAGLLAALAPGTRFVSGRSLSWRSPALVIATLAVSGLGIYFHYGYSAYYQALDASYKLDWPRASVWMQEAVRRDPANRLYAIQRGFVSGQLALNQDGSVKDDAALKVAIAAYEQALHQQSENSLDWANLAILYKAEGDLKAAQAAMQTSARLAYSNPVMQLNLGRIYEEEKMDDLAARSYQKAISLEPAWSDPIFSQGSPIWQSVQSQGERAAEIDDGQLALDSGNYAQAEKYYLTHLKVNDAESYRYYGLALFGLGRQTEADSALRTADFIDGTPLQAHILLHSTFQKLGYTDRVAVELKAILSILDNSSAYGPGLMGTADFVWDMYHRESFLPDLLPGWTNNISPTYTH
jgi:putative inorganic carbon (hco3(-)) transporter